MAFEGAAAVAAHTAAIPRPDPDTECSSAAKIEERVALLLTLHVLDSNTTHLVRAFERVAEEQPQRFFPFLVFDADLLNPEELRKNTVLPLVPARRSTEGSWLGTSYLAFSGIYGAPAKPRALRFMLEEAFQHAWVVESGMWWSGYSFGPARC